MQTLSPFYAALAAWALAAVPAQASTGPVPQRPSPVVAVVASPLPQLRLISKQEFCAKLSAAFVGLAHASGFDHLHTTLLASNAPVEVVEEFKSGRATDFMQTGLLRHLANVPPVEGDHSYVPLAGLVQAAIGVQGSVVLALAAAELRFVQANPPGTELVVVAQNAASLTPERVHTVAAMARQQQTHVSIIWVGGKDDAQDQADLRSLTWLAAVTGGSLTDLGGQTAGCAESL